MHHSEQKCAHFCSEWCIVGYGTGALWDFWDWQKSFMSTLSSHAVTEICPAPTMTTKLTSMVWWCIVVPRAICPSARPSRPRYHSSTSNNIQRILFIFGRAMLTLVGAWSLLIMGFLCSVALWNFMNTLTDFLPGLGRPGIPVLWTVFLYLMVHDENNIISFAVTW